MTPLRPISCATPPHGARREGSRARAAGQCGGKAGRQRRRRDLAGAMLAQRQMAFVHPFSFEFKRLAYEAVKRAR